METSYDVHYKWLQTEPVDANEFVGMANFEEVTNLESSKFLIIEIADSLISRKIRHVPYNHIKATTLWLNIILDIVPD